MSDEMVDDDVSDRQALHSYPMLPMAIVSGNSEFPFFFLILDKCVPEIYWVVYDNLLVINSGLRI
jgi:hypothetical protein